MSDAQKRIVVIGAGIGGLAAALRLSHAGHQVTVLESHEHPGGKIRTLATKAGPADAGPTVLTMRHVFDTLFNKVGERLDAHLTLLPLTVLARHFWPDGTRLDLSADQEQSVENIRQGFGQTSANEFVHFSERAKRLFEAFEAPMMQAAEPSQWTLTARVLREPSLIRAMAPHQSLQAALQSHFSDPRLQQLFGRYATYVGGMPGQSPALLSLIWHAEATGVWSIAGGMHRLARAIAGLAEARGAVFRYGTKAQQITVRNKSVVSVACDAGDYPADIVLFNGDPRAVQVGALGKEVRSAVPAASVAPRSLSANVYAFAARPSGLPLAHHNVFFSDGVNAEFRQLDRNQKVSDPTLYVCAQDAGQSHAGALQRFEIIMNAASTQHTEDEEKSQCQTLIFDRLARFGLTFDPVPDPTALTTPHGFHQLFPESLGSLYGRSPAGMMAAFKRPTARTSIRGLYLCGGGTHPGAGVPMATLSGLHAAEMILTDRTSISTSRKTVTRGGISTASRTITNKQSLS